MSNEKRFLRSKRLRALLWYTAGGKCQRCSCDLLDNFAADHIIPYSVSKQTNFHEMQVLCHKCNREKGAMQLRKHQEEMLQICDQIKAGVISFRTIVASVTPGGGKSLLPVIAAARLIPKVADAVCWIAPRESLQKQIELLPSKKPGYYQITEEGQKLVKDWLEKVPSGNTNGSLWITIPRSNSKKAAKQLIKSLEVEQLKELYNLIGESLNQHSSSTTNVVNKPDPGAQTL